MQSREMINAERRSGMFLESRKITQRGQKDQRRDVSGRVTLQATLQRKSREKREKICPESRNQICDGRKEKKRDQAGDKRAE